MGRTPRKFTADFKVKVVLDIITNGNSFGQASREYGIKDSVPSRWKQEFLERAPSVFENHATNDDRDQRTAKLERMLGKLTMQLEMAKKVSGYLRSHCNENEK